MRYLRLFLLLQVLGFAAAALVHAGILAEGHAHRPATIAESVIALVLVAGLAATLAIPRAARPVGLAVQAFALLGTLVGIFTIAIGVGPQSGFDVALHAGFVALLIAGLAVTARGGRGFRARCD